MKTEYTQAQLAALAQLYREQETEKLMLDAEAEELASEGIFVQRKRVLKDADRKEWTMRGIRLAAEAIGIPEDVLRKAAREGA